MQWFRFIYPSKHRIKSHQIEKILLLSIITSPSSKELKRLHFFLPFKDIPVKQGNHPANLSIPSHLTSSSHYNIPARAAFPFKIFPQPQRQRERERERVSAFPLLTLFVAESSASFPPPPLLHYMCFPPPPPPPPPPPRIIIIIIIQN
jgi:hypothetical protein